MEQELMDDFDREETLRRFPEIEDIQNDRLREQVINAVQELPSYFWVAAAASNHHQPEHRARHGLWLHTKRVVTIFERLAPSMVQQGFMEWEEVDYGRAAAILHDGFKYGLPPTPVDATTDDHDIVASSWFDSYTELPDEVVGAIEAHNGPWYQGRPPQTHLEQMVHIADMVASDENVRIAVKEPHPVLSEKFPRVNER